jgi:phosphoserine phosphatase
MMAMPEQPWWRQAYDWAEQTIGPQLEAGVQTDTFADFLAAVMKLRAELDRRQVQVAGQARALSAEWLHLINAAAADDVAQLREEILRLDRQVRDLTQRLDELGWKEGTDGRAGQPGGGAGADPR